MPRVTITPQKTKGRKTKGIFFFCDPDDRKRRISPLFSSRASAGGVLLWTASRPRSPEARG
jgi:hypothetical protein